MRSIPPSGRRCLPGLLTLLCALGAAAEEAPSAGDLFARCLAAYGERTSYRSEGTVESRVEVDGVLNVATTRFTLRMEKPNRYLLAWRQDAGGYRADGAVWHAGDGAPFFYMGPLNAYSQMANHEVALGAATGLSGGAAFTLPSLFLGLPSHDANPFSRLRSPAVVREEEQDGVACYVVGGPSSISREELFWIGKEDHLIRKYVRSLEPPAGGMEMPEADDAALKDAIRQLGREVNEESLTQMRALMETAREMTEQLQMKGSFTEVHADIASPEWAEEDFVFDLPARAVLRDSLFEEMGGILEGQGAESSASSSSSSPDAPAGPSEGEHADEGADAGAVSAPGP